MKDQPDEVVAHIQRADLLDDLGRHDEAAEELAAALALQPDNADALAMLALTQLRAGRHEEALAAAEAAISAQPGLVNGYVARGYALVELERYADAADAADVVLTADPDSWSAHLHAALILSSSRGGQRALDAAWRAVQLAPERAETHRVLGLVAANLELTDVAERAYAEAMRLEPDSAENRVGLAGLRIDAGKYTEGLGHAVAAARSAPTLGREAVIGALTAVIRWGVLYAWIAPILAIIGGIGPGSRLAAGLFGAVGLGGVLLVYRGLG